MKILKVDPGKVPEVMEIENSLEAMQAVVGGLIQAVYPFEEAVAMVVNEEGKLMGLELNRALRNPKSGVIYDVVCGTFFLCGVPADSENFTDLTEEQLVRYTDYYKDPEVFIKAELGITVIKKKEEG